MYGCRDNLRVAANVVGADRKVSDLEALDVVHIQALIEHTVLDDAVALLGGHGARLAAGSGVVSNMNFAFQVQNPGIGTDSHHGENSPPSSARCSRRDA